MAAPANTGERLNAAGITSPGALLILWAHDIVSLAADLDVCVKEADGFDADVFRAFHANAAQITATYGAMQLLAGTPELQRRDVSHFLEEDEPPTPLRLSELVLEQLAWDLAHTP